MPKMMIHTPAGIFAALSREQLVTALTDLALECENLPKTPFVRSTVWIYFNEYPADSVYMAGKPATAKIISLVIYALEGGLDEPNKRRLIAGATALLGRHAGLEGRIPAYVVIREVPETNWGIFGEQGNLEALRNMASDLSPL
ncbi:tautomerase family protein [Aliirhizobium cellulosilyticum]|uniref:Phenylpyruvate tautomerase PptA (4-oxalocrotonate tautomerase family) n=1 Tax=Aliirhizobium cellulosilyticum TaxID=393664 RepID=A0A7W6SC74_9HYPH|nr:tautomerase family protein [Rhizobium cellulosilyticum]MBB4351054.1 phenylpyruvate tautomerase PptA (4-oxalocrotonate tautomerase family) [Rhizobium cellulosilyticum]MBB4414370.1 phenylpyruvate tautomerase PptA (4-oxalocrotonate tautomerase family) [Rhizobium cellulosilyticum]MBB4448986.1 phenylpyruvate tautomerase PptA (4-oxalocrotonate tautomerase family) [Rhizobium cellulosilyticum]